MDILKMYIQKNYRRISSEYQDASSDLWIRVCLHVCEWIWDVSEYERATFQEFYVGFLIQSAL